MTPASPGADWLNEALKDAEAQPGPTITITKALYAFLNERAFPPHAMTPPQPQDALRAAQPRCVSCGHHAGYHGSTFCDHDAGAGKRRCDCAGWQARAFLASGAGEKP